MSLYWCTCKTVCVLAMTPAAVLLKAHHLVLVCAEIESRRSSLGRIPRREITRVLLRLILAQNPQWPQLSNAFCFFDGTDVKLWQPLTILEGLNLASTLIEGTAWEDVVVDVKI